MRIYISGKISGLSLPEVQERFGDAESLLSVIGFEVVNPMKNGLSQDSTWNEHLCKDIELLLPCEAIYMMDNWIDSTGASIEYDIAVRTGKDIWFESQVVTNTLTVMRIQNAIHEVMGMKFSEYATQSKKREYFFARMIFAYHCRQHHMHLSEIAAYVKRNHSTMTHLLKKYEDDIKFSPQFRDIATKVNNLLNEQ